MEKELEFLRLEHNSEGPLDLAYRVEKIRSIFIEIDTLMAEVPPGDSRSNELLKQITLEIQ
jgi:hypothetical protein